MAAVARSLGVDGYTKIQQSQVDILRRIESRETLAGAVANRRVIRCHDCETLYGPFSAGILIAHLTQHRGHDTALES